MQRGKDPKHFVEIVFASLSYRVRAHLASMQFIRVRHPLACFPFFSPLAAPRVPTAHTGCWSRSRPNVLPSIGSTRPYRTHGGTIRSSGGDRAQRHGKVSPTEDSCQAVEACCWRGADTAELAPLRNGPEAADQAGRKSVSHRWPRRTEPKTLRQRYEVNKQEGDFDNHPIRIRALTR